MTTTESTPIVAQHAYRVLLVDDSPDFVELVKEHLVRKRDPSWIVHTAYTYADALARLKAYPIDLVVTDINMPVMDGLQLLTMIKRSRPALPVVVLSGVVTPENRDYALQHGAALVLSKTDLAGGVECIYPALEATAEMPAEGFKGVVRQVGLTEILQLECLGRKSSVLEIKGHKADGRIYICEGFIIHAEVGDLLGEKALARLYGLAGGEFRLAPYREPSRRTIDGNWEGLLLEAAQYSDEQAGELALQISEGQTGSDLGPKAVAEQAGGADRRVEEIVLSSSTNDILHEWKSQQSDRRVRLMDWLLSKSATVTNLCPSLGRAERLEINEPRSRVICLLQPERKMFVRLSVTSPNE